MKNYHWYVFVIVMLCYVSFINKRDEQLFKTYDQDKIHKEYCAYHYNSPKCK